MAFVNENIPESDYEKYDLRRICGEHNLQGRRGDMHSISWTVDRDRESFLLKVWAHHESDFSGYAFYWKGGWMFFEMGPTESNIAPDWSSCWFKFLIKGFVIPYELEARQKELLSDLQAAITQIPGGTTWNYARRSATIEFSNEPASFPAPSFFVQPNTTSIKE